MLLFIRFYQKKTVLCVELLFLLIVLTGCRPSEPLVHDQDSQQSIIDAAAEANVRFEITNLYTENNISTNWEEERAKAKQTLNKTILEISELPSVSIRDRHYKTLVQQLIYEYRFAEAADVAAKIQDKTIKDALLEDFVRFQIQDIWQMYQKTENFYNDGELSKEILTALELVIRTAGIIDDPLLQAESFENIARFRIKMKDRNGTIKMMIDAAESCRHRKENGIRKALGLCSFANWFLREENKEKTLEFCKEAETILVHTKQSFDSIRTYLDISAIYFLLGLDKPAQQLCEKVEKSISAISDPHEKAALLLKLAESLLVIRLKDSQTPLAEQLLSIKKFVLEAADILAQLSDNETEVNLPAPQVSQSFVLSSPKGVFSENDLETKFRPLSRLELVHLKNGLFRKIASMQAWGGTLEEVWETIEEIDPGNERDDALVSVIDMMIITRSSEDIEAWAEEIIDPVKKNTVLKKLNQQE
ncbi:MAG: hypothetical protein LBC20_18420 [Planctomycetaceae bacterium]|jgi:hypothetical protein|nr:hypothetical protein [Planctomycetaceae bacterium]